jgi:hypothetical protein
MRELIIRGLQHTQGNYRALLLLFKVPQEDYKRFHNFLDAHDCKVDYRTFRKGLPGPARVRRPLLSPLEEAVPGSDTPVGPWRA